MSTIVGRTQRAMFFIALGIIGLSLFAPLTALADSDLVAGDQGVVTAESMLRGDPSYDAAVVATVPGGTAVSIVDGPVTASDGSLWYFANALDVTGFLPAGAISATSTDTSPEDVVSDDVPKEVAVPAEDTSDVIPWKDAVDYGVVVNNTGEALPEGGLACRAAATADAEILTRVAEGSTLEVTGDELWIEGMSFYPVNCAGQGGFVKGDYVVLASAQTEAVDVVATEEVVATEVIPTSDVANEGVAAQAPATGDLIVTLQDQDALPVAGACFQLIAGDSLIAEACDSTDEIPDNGNSGFFDVSAGTYRLVAASTADGSSVDERDVTITAGERQTELVVLDTRADVVTEEVVTEEATPTEVVATDVAVTEEVAATEVVVTEEAAINVVAPQETAPEVVATEAVATEVAPTEVMVTEEVAINVLAPQQTASEVAATEQAAPTEATVTEEIAINVLAPQQTAPDSVATEPVAPGQDSTVAAAAKATATEAAAPAAAPAPADQQAGAATTSANTTEGEQRVDTSRSIGSAEVQGTNGDGLRCRIAPDSGSETITVLEEGASVIVLAEAQNGYLGIVCADQAGWADVNYLWSGGLTEDEMNASSDFSASAGTATISGTNGDGVRCRTGASTSSSIIAVVPEGTKIVTRGDASGGWVPVNCYGYSGFISSMYVSLDGGSTGSAPDTSSGSVRVTGTGGGGLRCRAGGSTAYSVITVVAEGASLTVRGGASGGWLPVTCAGQLGFVSTDYVSGGSGATSPPPSAPGGGGSALMAWGTISGTGGDGVRCRSGASTSSSVIAVIPEGTMVGMRGGASGGWVPINCYGYNGFVSSMYLSSGGGSGSTPAPPPSTPSGMVANDHAKVTSNLNLRYSASTGAGVASVAPAGTVVLITGGATSNFYPVDWDGLRGFMSADYLVKTSEALSERGGSGAPAPQPPTSGGGNATGNSMADFALRYQGYPYVWATHGPSSFDCSGFTYWVTKNVTGRDIGTGLWTQVSAGTPVSRANLQPGDLVFFQNTYKAGLSHSGVYIGNNQFIHAENESTGVKISDLNSTYYGSRWYGAVRMT